ncbi:MAG: 16S rRNA (cytosine(1402)-N(4))-methyltransferase RsmH [Actinomycetes bacterium]|jgi:16S rRNA (cytosine1402-N4)-methyltransferase
MQHIPVALERCIALLAPAIERCETPIIIDATLGLGGHSKVLLERYPQLRIIGFDRDLSAIALAKENLKDFIGRVTIVHAIYDEITNVLEELEIPGVDGVLFDLGVSSMQLDVAERGFAYSQDAPLDMRMDQSRGISAYDVLHTYQRGELIRILRQYGEEKFAKSIADNIIKARENNALSTTKELAEIVKASIPAPARRTGGNPAKRTFQALRIEVNQELDVLERAIPAALDSLNVGGRIVVMAYQSLEDKIVKKVFSSATESLTPRGLPVELPDSAAKFAFVIRGSESATKVEIEANPRAQSMRLRAIERLAA